MLSRCHPTFLPLTGFVSWSARVTVSFGSRQDKFSNLTLNHVIWVWLSRAAGEIIYCRVEL